MRRAVLMLVAAVLLAPLPASASPTYFCLGEQATIVGTSGDDELRGTDSHDVIVGLGGRDKIYGFRGNDRICLGPGDPPDDLLDLQTGSGGAGRDLIQGGNDPEYLGGGRGRDRIWAGGGGDHVSGGAGNDRIWGNRGRDRLDGGAGFDHVHGGGGQDGLEASPQDDVLHGGRGNSDFVGFNGAAGPARGDLSEATSNAANLGTDRIVAMEGFLGSKWPDVFKGDEEDNFFYGYDGDDEMGGRGGDDCFLPSSGTNRIYGGEGLDTYSADPLYGCDLDSSFNGPIIDRGDGEVIDLPVGQAGNGNDTTLLDSIEGAIGSSQGDLFRGDDGPNVFFGGGGGDEMYGAAGDDHLDGAGGEDQVDGGDGYDVCVNTEIFLNCEEGGLRLLLYTVAG
jgi:Ca2+-binding RTX toxin-like protein